MSALDRRHRGRAIRRARKRNGPTASVAFVTIEADLHGFMRQIERLTKALGSFSRAYQHPRQIIRNGRKPRA